MRFLADKNISYRLCALLDNAGHQAAHADQFSLGAAEDAVIMGQWRPHAHGLSWHGPTAGSALAYSWSRVLSTRCMRAGHTGHESRTRRGGLDQLGDVVDALGERGGLGAGVGQP